MLWPSRWRWKFQRRRMGKFPCKPWNLHSDCTVTSKGLASKIPASNNKCAFCYAHNCETGVWLNQSTTEPSMENSKASNTPMVAVSSVIATIKPRTPALAAHKNGKNPAGGCGGGP